MSAGKLYFQVKWFQCKEQWKILTYYKNFRFFLSDILLHLIAFFHNPYRAVRKSENNLGPYGETPISTMRTILSHLNPTPKDHFYDLGCGRGRALFWLSLFTPCTITGVEKLPSFLFFGKKIALMLRMNNIHFLREDFRKVDLSEATIVYLYGTTLSEKDISSLMESFKQLPKDAKVLTISFPLQTNYLQVEKKFPVTFPWGDTTAFLHRKV